MRATTKSVVDLDTILDINAFSVDETLARLDREAAEAAAAAAAAAGAGAGAGGDAAHTHAHSHSHDDHDHTGDDCTHPSHAHAHGESSAAGEFSLFCSFYRMTEYSCNLIILYMILIITIFSRKRPCAVASSARAARPFGLDVQRQPQRGALASAPYALARRDSVG
jgi:hypothetical protein